MAASGFTARGALVLLALISAAGCETLRTEHAAPSQASAPHSGPREVTFEFFDAYKYASFIYNWDDKKAPLFMASIRSSEDWRAVFGTAAVPGNARPYRPDPELYTTHQILVASRVVASPQSADTFTVDSVTDNDGHLTVRYRFKHPEQPGTAWFKNVLGLVIPRGDYIDATFVENGQQVGVLPMNTPPTPPGAQ